MDLQDLIKLARDQAKEKRRVLLENLSELFISSEGRLSEREQALMADILMNLIRDVEMSVRRELAERLTDIDWAPHDLVVDLANDEIDVARPILMRSGVLQDVDLIEVVKHRTDEHLLAVTARDKLSEDVTDALVENGGEDVIEALLRNSDAVLSRRAMEHIVDESRRVDRFQQPLLGRGDLPADLAHRMFWWVSAALREHILATYSVDEAVMDDVIVDTTRALLDKAESETPELSSAERLVRRLAENGELNDRFLVRAAKQGKVQVFTAGLANLCHLSLDTARHIVLEPGGEALAVAWKAMGFERADFAAVALATRKPTRGNEATIIMQRLLGLYDSISEENARHALRYWRLDRDYERAVARIEE